MHNIKKSKLLIIDPSNVRGGAQEYWLKIAKSASDRDWQVHTAFPNCEGTKSLVSELALKNICSHDLQIDDSKYFTSVKLIVNRLIQFLRTIFLLIRIKPTSILIVLPSINTGFAAIVACAVLNIKTCVVFQLAPIVVNFGNSKLRAYDWARSRNQQWIAVSEHNRKILSQTFQVDTNRIMCILNGVPPIKCSDLTDVDKIRTEVRSDLGLPLNSKILLTVGRLDPQKGHDLIIEVAKYIFQEFDDIMFVWVGAGDYKSSLENKMRIYDVCDRIKMLGHRQDVVKLLAAADLFVFPTYYEGLPFALAEAMSSGLPIVASDAGCVPELIHDREHGLLFHSGDSCDFYHQLRWALNNMIDMKQMSDNASIWIQEFSEETMISKTLLALSE